MSVIQFESTVEGNLIRIPERYIGQIPDVVTVTLGDVDVEKPQFVSKIQKDLPNLDEFPAILDTKGWKFNREEANERR